MESKQEQNQVATGTGKTQGVKVSHSHLYLCNNHCYVLDCETMKKIIIAFVLYFLCLVALLTLIAKGVSDMVSHGGLKTVVSEVWNGHETNSPTPSK